MIVYKRAELEEIGDGWFHYQETYRDPLTILRINDAQRKLAPSFRFAERLIQQSEVVNHVLLQKKVHKLEDGHS